MSATVCVEVTGQPQGLVPTLHLETGSLLLFPGYSELAGPRVRRCSFSTSCLAVDACKVPHLGFTWVQRIRTQFLKLARQALYPLGPSPPSIPLSCSETVYVWISACEEKGRRPERGIGSPGAGVTGSCELPNDGAGS